MGTGKFRKREDLIGQTGHLIRQIEVLDAKENLDGEVQVYISDGMGIPFWTELNSDISLD